MGRDPRLGRMIGHASGSQEAVTTVGQTGEVWLSSADGAVLWQRGEPLPSGFEFIDGQPPTAAVPPDPRVREAVEAIVTAHYLYGPGHGRDLWNTTWDALRALAPDIAKMEPRDAFALLFPEDA